MTGQVSDFHRQIFCVGCSEEVTARLTDGEEIYPHRNDLYDKPLWKCDTCGNYVGCHDKTDDRTRPLGVIPTARLRTIRSHIHATIDPIWRNNWMSRREVYRKMSAKIGKPFHSAEIRSDEEAFAAHRAAEELYKEMEAMDCPAYPQKR